MENNIIYFIFDHIVQITQGISLSWGIYLIFSVGIIHCNIDRPSSGATKFLNFLWVFDTAGKLAKYAISFF